MESATPCASNITFMAIKDFVEALVSVFGTGGGKTPLGLYNRLICHVEGRDSIQGVEKYISGFKSFFSEFGSKLESNEDMMTIPRNTVIKYGDNDNIFIEIQKFIYKSRSMPERLDIIRKHLLTISATIKPEENLLLALEKTPVNIPRDIDFGEDFIKREMDNIREVLENGNIDMSDPTNAMVALANSGAIMGLIERLKMANDAGQINPEKMLANLQKTLCDLSGDVEGIDLNQITDLTSQYLASSEFAQNLKVEAVEEVD